jgi:hypothetical protein
VDKGYNVGIKDDICSGLGNGLFMRNGLCDLGVLILPEDAYSIKKMLMISPTIA